VRNVLVVQTSFLGDLVLTTPLLGEIRRRFPEARVSVLATPRAAPILEGHPAVDRVLVDDKRGRDRGLGGVLAAAARLAGCRFDTVLSPHKSLRTALCLRLARIPRRIGFRESRGWFLFTDTVRRDRDRHDVERNLCLLRAFGIEPEECERRLELAVSPGAAAAAERLLAEVAPGAGPLHGIAPGSVWATKRWRAAGFAEVARRLVEEHGGRALVLGGPEDRTLAEEIVRRSGGKAADLAGRTDLPALVAVIARLDCLVTNDSAPLHIGSALGVPRVAVFCATSPRQGFGPWGEHAAVVETDLECRPCARHGGPRCPRGTADCIELVTTADVMRRVREVLEVA
jgi:heptosyltransferase-2